MATASRLLVRVFSSTVLPLSAEGLAVAAGDPEQVKACEVPSSEILEEGPEPSRDCSHLI
jgi:hypothetical protein